ncbi:MAG: RusA family crossover junction endodeoxyribonuclease [Patescibacteria group bacterium]|nr:RusA family crossover junction endodeoxyribonuclease [Patescibacteria group bacterium]MDE2227361.1 RusA family crossover junction endodeoxyribonuclease [Patescibacteria group bacterium]
MPKGNLSIKPLSVNDAYRGRRFKTSDYNNYEKEVFLLLPPAAKIPKGKLKLKCEFGFSSRRSDIDNALKPFIDILQKKYGFDDRIIYRLEIEKTLVAIGKEFIKFELSGY